MTDTARMTGNTRILLQRAPVPARRTRDGRLVILIGAALMLAGCLLPLAAGAEGSVALLPAVWKRSSLAALVPASALLIAVLAFFGGLRNAERRVWLGGLIIALASPLACASLLLSLTPRALVALAGAMAVNPHPGPGLFCLLAGSLVSLIGGFLMVHRAAMGGRHGQYAVREA